MNEKRRAAAVRLLPYPGQFRQTKHDLVKDLVKAWLLSGLTVRSTGHSSHWSNLEVKVPRKECCGGCGALSRWELALRCC